MTETLKTICELDLAKTGCEADRNCLPRGFARPLSVSCESNLLYSPLLLHSSYATLGGMM